MKKQTYPVLCLITFLFICSVQLFAQPKIIGYLPTWAGFPNSVNSVQLTKLTHLNVAFANPNSSAAIILADGRTTSHLATVVTACHNQNVKVFLSIGGAGASGSTYQGIMSNSTKMNTFVTNLVNYCTNNSLDGIDVDIEGDVLNGSYVTKAQYETFVTALGTALHNANFKMSSALANWFGSNVTNLAAAQYDWINIMSYDAVLPSDNAGEHSTYNQAVSDFNYWKNTKGVPGSKLVIGVPFYGYGWGSYANSQEIAYSTIVATYANAETKDKIGTSPNMISYNGIPTIQQKTTYACANGGGIMIWQLTEDATGAKSLLSAIYDQITVCSTAQEEVTNVNDFSVYPNPCSKTGYVQLNTENASFTTIKIVNQLGQEVQLIHQANLAAGDHQISFDASDLSKGLYYIQILNNQQSTIKTMMVE